MDYLNLITRVHEEPGLMGGNRITEYYVGEKFMIEISSRPVDPKSKADIVNMWYKKGWISKPIKQFLHVRTFFYDEKGNCCGWYNPTYTPDWKIDCAAFDYEDTMQNREAILRAAIRMREMDIRCGGKV